MTADNATTREVVKALVVAAIEGASDREAAIRSFARTARERLTGDQVDLLIEMGAVKLAAHARAAEGLARYRSLNPERPGTGPRDTRPSTEATWSPPASTGEAMAGRLRMIAPRYDWTLPNGADLMAACLRDLEIAIEASRAAAQRSVAEVKLYSEIRQRMLAAKVHTVADVFTVAQVKQLREKHGLDNE